mmetsp:Transcript_49054/g.59383  ORF Transcript_49054/g.59383 Transcript_49054/m.59383 type:complete len:272 (+) Transcript_49054:811-1626(+)
MACAPACISIQFSKPMESAIGVPMADQREYRPPTQSQNPNMLFVSIPNSLTPLALVLRAAKCFAMDDSSLSKLFKTHCLALLALVIVSCVVNVLLATRKSVVSGSHFLRISAICVPSTFEQKCIDKSRFVYGFKASHTITGPRSDPPIPIFTIVSIDFPVWPFHTPLRTFSVKTLILASVSFTSGMTSLPSTRMGVLDWFRSATWSTARPSVALIFSPEYIFFAIPLTSCCSASLYNSSIVSSLMRFLEKSKRRSSNLRLNLLNLSGSAAN